MRLAMAELALVADWAERKTEDAEVEDGNDDNDRKAWNGPQHGIVDDIGPGLRLQRRHALRLQFRRRDLQAPSKKQDGIHPDVIAFEPAVHRVPIAEQETRFAQAAGDHRGPFSAGPRVWRQNLRKIAA